MAQTNSIGAQSNMLQFSKFFAVTGSPNNSKRTSPLCFIASWHFRQFSLKNSKGPSASTDNAKAAQRAHVI